jgi:hypothetical protein
VSPAVSSHQLRSRHVSAASASSHGPLTTRINTCRSRAQQLLGALDPSLPREGASAGQAPGGYYRCSGYWGIPVHLLLGHFNDPASAWDQIEDRSLARKTLMRRRLMRRTTTKLLRTRTPPREVFLMRGRTISMSAQHVPVLGEKIRMKDGVPSMLPRQGGDQLMSCLHKATRWLLTTPLKIGWMVQGAREGCQPSSTHSGGSVPLLYED